MNQEKTFMAVTANHFSLYEAFKKEVEKIGWTYNLDFTDFKQNSGHDCLYFSFEFGGMKGEPAFALSNTGESKFQLECQFEEALNCAKRLIKRIRAFELNENYTAIISMKDETVTVGCQEFSFDKVLELAKLINKTT